MASPKPALPPLTARPRAAIKAAVRRPGIGNVLSCSHPSPFAEVAPQPAHDASSAILRRDIGPPFPPGLRRVRCLAQPTPTLPLEDDPCAASFSFPTDSPGHSPVASPHPSLGR
ncbi:hypothetical protein MAP00_006157 [Monascus purpureus]|nr:hypothetical protein MAP00_006157 [Monascus purpureus]